MLLRTLRTVLLRIRSTVPVKILRTITTISKTKDALIQSDVQITQLDFFVRKVQKRRRNPVGFQVVFVQYSGKYASKMYIKAYAVIDSEIP